MPTSLWKVLIAAAAVAGVLWYMSGVSNKGMNSQSSEIERNDPPPKHVDPVF